ncbi:hypothetical protein [Methylosinus sporium]|uniref:Uncharacterized protein n=1 Tax=Methylosinus sporium TaxID=428 RepID=A0A2U1SPU3_METSR|nr:hypothetical protein [Methylosinus sporium]PWB93631.1 hypothetical protein C5689_12260 [Methylosinus sporium]
MDSETETCSRRAFVMGLLAALVASPLIAGPSEAQAQERQFVRPSHTPHVAIPRSHVRGPRTHRSLFRVRRRVPVR